MTQKNRAALHAPDFTNTERRRLPLRLIRTRPYRSPFMAVEPTVRLRRGSGSASRVAEPSSQATFEEECTGRFRAPQYPPGTPTLRVPRIADLPARGEGRSGQGHGGRSLQLLKSISQQRAQVKRPPEPKLRYLQTVALRPRSTASRLPGPRGGVEERLLARESREVHEGQCTGIYRVNVRQFTNRWTDHRGEASPEPRASAVRMERRSESQASRAAQQVPTVIIKQGQWDGWGVRALRVIVITLVAVALGGLSVLSNIPLAEACLVTAVLLYGVARGWRPLQRLLRARRGRQLLELRGGTFSPEERRAIRAQFSR